MHYVYRLRVSLSMAYTLPSLRLFNPSGSAFSSTKFSATLHAASFSNQTSRLTSNSMSQPAATDSSTLSTPEVAPSPPDDADVMVQYVVLRRDLIDTWPLGSVVTQGCHASVSAVWSNKEDPVTIDYCSPDKIDSMHKVRFWFSIFFFFSLTICFLGCEINLFNFRVSNSTHSHWNSWYSSFVIVMRFGAYALS